MPEEVSTLPREAIAELRAILCREMGPEALQELTEEAVVHFGVFLLTIHAEALKRPV